MFSNSLEDVVPNTTYSILTYSLCIFTCVPLEFIISEGGELHECSLL